MEAIIELARRLELLRNLEAPMPASPREAVERYFGLPRLDFIWRTQDRSVRQILEERMRNVRNKLLLRLEFDRLTREFSIEIRDRGIGQAPECIHSTLLSLGRTDKADKPYLIGVFGQGGSSTYAASQYSVIVSRRAPECLDNHPDGVGWTIVRKIVPKGRRDPFYAYLAALPEGQVPAASADGQFEPGVMFRHIDYDFGRQGSAVARTLFYALNHVLHNPVLPYDLYALKDKPDSMSGIGARLTRRTTQLQAKGIRLLDKSFQPQTVGDSFWGEESMPLSSDPAEPPMENASNNDFGSIGIRVVVLPRKAEIESRSNDSKEIIDLAEGEDLPEEGQTPVTSYLERPKSGRLCCVFLVNGQRHDGLDNSFIVQRLGFKYLRNRMLIIVDVDSLRSEALGDLMQGSRQGFYKGRVWEAIYNRLIATLKGDPDIQKLEEEAEAEVAELQAGDQKVKEALDTLIESHHQYADHVVGGAGAEPGLQGGGSVLGVNTPITDSLVTLLSPNQGDSADYPVLISAPSTSALHLRPDVERTLIISSKPSNTWPALASFAYALDSRIPELHIAEARSETSVGFRFKFSPPEDFDEDDYPIRTTFRAFARFNGYKEARQLAIELSMRPISSPSDPKLSEHPTYIRVTSRQPARLWLNGPDTHVRIQWDGNDALTLGQLPQWSFKAHCVTPGRHSLITAFSNPSKGRFSLLVTLPPDSRVGEQLCFEIIATGPDGKTLSTVLEAVVADRPTRPQPEPRLVSGTMPIGASRRPPYDLRYIKRDAWNKGTCFGGEDWTVEDAAAYQEPTEKRPLTLLINQDMESLEVFKKILVRRKLTETEVQSRLQKYTSHVAFHLYQMYQFAQAVSDRSEDDSLRPVKPQEQRAEIRRVATTLLRLMEISR